MRKVTTIATMIAMRPTVSLKSSPQRDVLHTRRLRRQEERHLLRAARGHKHSHPQLQPNLRGSKAITAGCFTEVTHHNKQMQNWSKFLKAEAGRGRPQKLKFVHRCPRIGPELLEQILFDIRRSSAPHFGFQRRISFRL